MIFEIHTPKFHGTNMTVNDYAKLYHDMNQLESKLGFQLYSVLNNNCCRRFAILTHSEVIENERKRDICCYELFYVNNNFAPKFEQPSDRKYYKLR